MKAKELLATPDKWTKAANARDASGKSVGYCHADAVCWCLNGAIFQCYPVEIERAEAHNKLAEVIRVRHGYTNVPVFNDHPTTTHITIKAVLEAADV